LINIFCWGSAKNWGVRVIGAIIYSGDYILQDLRLLSEAALALLWRLDPEAAIPAPEWSSKFLHSDAQRAASELMHVLLLILDQVDAIETVPLQNNPGIPKGRTKKTGYLLRYVQQDLFALERGLTELAYRLPRPKCRLTGSNLRGRQLRWLAQNLVARADPILEAVNESTDWLTAATGMKLRISFEPAPAS
jgi:hypothetical protein